MSIDFWSEAYDDLNLKFKMSFEELSASEQLQLLQFKALMSIAAELSCIARDELPHLTTTISDGLKMLRRIVEALPDRLQE